MVQCVEATSLYLNASFRGVSFDVWNVDDTFGQRGPLHKYPDRQTPYNEFLGREPRFFKIEGYFRGDDHVQRARALAAAVEVPVPGTLVHPIFGTHLVKARKLEVKHNLEEKMRVTTFVLECEEAGVVSFPILAGPFGSNVSNAADSLRTTLPEAYSRTFSLTGLPIYLIEESLRAAGEAATLIAELFPGRVEWNKESIAAYEAIVALAEAPETPVRSSGAILVDGIAALADWSIDRAKTVEAMERLAVFRPLDTSTRSIHPNRAKVDANINATVVVVRVSAIAEMARIVFENRTYFASYSAALTWRDRMALLWQQELSIAARSFDLVLYKEVLALGKAISNTVIELGPSLPSRIIIRTCDEMPSLIAAFRLLGSAGRAADIEAGNPHASTFFMPKTLEVVRAA